MASDGKACSPQMLHVHVQIQQAAVRTSTNDFQLKLPKSNPSWGIGIALRYVVAVSSCFPCLCPGPCDVQRLEIHVCAVSNPIVAHRPAREAMRAQHALHEGCL